MADLLAVAAPAAPAAGITAGLILLCCVFVALYGLQHGYQYSLGALIRRMADVVEDIWIVGGPLADALDNLDSWVMRQIGNGLRSVEQSIGRLWAGLAWLFREMVDAQVDFASAALTAIAGLVDGEIPAQVDTRTRPLAKDIAGTRAALDERLRAEALARSRGIDAVDRDLTREALARERGIDAVNERITSLVLPRIRALDRAVADVVGYTRRNLRARIRSLERALAAGALGAVAVAAMTRVFPYWQCTNVRKANRLVCRLPIGLLDDLLALGLGALVLQDICRISALMRRAATAALPALRGLVVVVDAATECTSYPKPPPLTLATTALPVAAAGGGLVGLGPPAGGGRQPPRGRSPRQR